MKYALVLDAGTTNIKAFVFAKDGTLVARASRPTSTSKPKEGWVEQDPVAYARAAAEVLREAVAVSKLDPALFVGLGIATQRETVIAWDKKTGQPFGPAIVWQDTRTQQWCDERLAMSGALVRERTGLRLLPYFSGSKMTWLLEQVPAVAQAHAENRLAIGTMDTWLVWQFTNNHAYRTDMTNASRTALLNIHKGMWDPELRSLFGVPEGLLAEVLPTCSVFGELDEKIIGCAMPIAAVVGDQQASLYAAGNLLSEDRHVTKVTFGTGMFILQYRGPKWFIHNSFFTTLAADSHYGVPRFALEAKIGECASRVTPFVGDKEALLPVLRSLAEQAAVAIGRLPTPPNLIVIDGGVTQDDRLAGLLAAASGIPVRLQMTSEATALGTAQLVFETLRGE
ncbi:MAG: hypothetical protein COU11_00335 [Candidatus Harrisonbacteria bacterium CG10_big_fil_rev_8_21_14_0_10_49_15]|uniref:ATP:glycerol 3-phosphotransferase n=1 Tax=Candidatus Harrisonbacteria bacterium CG10_big_fil_rev_8_21_14_0_10_49_15 TaxID=1974587 RepID=A0A2H0UM40_9BACT|nr:MAG: hypothetical protein COU11_00335 [Candidatus Harrisonbacteria bacterium CG10_big_fil_rev_8_21_14_0_10_49_15]